MADVLAFDLGGSSLRLAIVSADGAISHVARVPLEIVSLGGGAFEADPEIWWQAFLTACEDLVGQGADLARVGAVSGCGYTRTQVTVDSQGRAVRPAFAFQDSRGADALEDFLRRAGAPVDGKALQLSPFHPISRLLWLKACEPENWRRTVSVIEPKDYLNLSLTGAAVSDRISQHSLLRFFRAVEADSAILGALGIEPSILPRHVSPFAEIGPVRDGLPSVLAQLAGRPVFCGGPDTWACVLGSGGLRQGAAYVTCGTSDVLGVISDTPCTGEGLLSVQWGPRHWQLGGPSQGAASRLQWAVNQFRPGLPLAEAVKDALASDSAPPVFLPYLDGERTPFWDADLRGAFVGVDSGHEARDFLRAVCEGLAFLSRMIFERAEAAADMTAVHVCLSGGLARIPALCQLRADVLGRDVAVPTAKEAGLVGAALLAQGNEEEIDDISERILVDAAWYHPDASKRAALDERYEVFRQASDALTPVSHRVARGSEGRSVTG